MKLKFLLLALMLSCVTSIFADQSDSNYGTDAVAVIVKQANVLYNKGRLEEAKVLYEQALASGDKFYSKKCVAQLNLIDNLLESKKKKRRPVFTISEDTVRINYLGGDYPILVTGDNWSAVVGDGSEGWCSVDVDRKRGLVKIYSSPNETTHDRSTSITIRNGNGQKKTVIVINDGSPEFLRSSAQSLVFTPSGETNIVDIDANTAWDIVGVPVWLDAKKGVDDIQFTAAANEENKERVAQVKVGTSTKKEIIINIIQEAALDSLAFSKNDLHFGPEGGDEYIRVLTDADDWRFGDFPYWCQLKRINDNTILVHCTPNEPVDMPREASVNVTTGNQTLGINVSQDPKPIVHVIPKDGIGGRAISFGFRAGYVYPMISANSSTPNTYSMVNYTIGGAQEQASYSSSGGFVVGAFADFRLYKNLYLNAGLNVMHYKYSNGIACNMELTMPQTSSFYLKGDALANFEEEYSMTLLELPIMASYRIPVTNKSHFQINLGPVVSFGLSSKLNLSGRTNSEQLRAYSIINGNMTSIPYDNGRYSSHLNYSGSFDLYSTTAELGITTSDGNNASTSERSDFDASPYKRVNLGMCVGVAYEYMGISLSVAYQYMFTNLADKGFWDGDRWTVFGNASQLMPGYSQRNNLLQITIGYTFRY